MNNSIPILASGGSKLRATLLWTNSSPNTSFDAQTLNLNLSSYTCVLISYTNKAGLNGVIKYDTIGFIGAEISLVTNFVNRNNVSQVTAVRRAMINNDSIVFEKGKADFEGGGVSEDNTWAVPYKIYGIK